MLGKYGGGGPSSYVAQAGDKHSYFSVGEHWDDIKKAQGLSDAQMFDKYNVPFLDDAIKEGKTFHFSHDPRVADGALRDEYIHLKNNDFIFVETTMTMSLR